MKKNTSSFIWMTLVAILIGITNVVTAATITYSETSGNWTDAANWTPQAPVAGDNIVIPAGAIVTVNTDLSAIKYNKITVNGKLIISETGKIYFEQTVLASPIFEIAGGEVENIGELVIKQTLANNTTVALQFSDHADRDDKFTNNGILTIDNTIATNNSTTGRTISFTQTSAGRVAHFTMGGTMNLNIKTQMRFIELLGGKAEISGTATIGSPTDYKNWRFLHLNLANGATNSVTFTPDANITVYTAFDSGNGCININTVNNATVSLINKGTLTLNGGGTFTTGAFGISVNPQASSTGATNAILTNEGVLNINGHFPGGGIFLTGAAQAGSLPVLNNTEGAILNISNTATGVNATAIRATNTAVATIIANNSGTMNLSTAIAYSMLFGKSNSTFNNNGVVNVEKSITGYDNSTTGCIITNNIGGLFNFNVADNAANAISTTNKIVFTNNGGTITGRGIIGAGTFVPSTGTIEPGGSQIGTFTFSDASLALTGKLKMNATGSATAGTDYDQVNSTGTLDISDATLEFTADYSTQNFDNLALVEAGILSGTFSSVTKPANWVTNYTSTAANLIFDMSTVLNNGTLDNRISVSNNTLLFFNIENGTYTITDMTGRIIKKSVVNSQNSSLSVSDLKGVYIISITSEKGNFTQKIII